MMSFNNLKIGVRLIIIISVSYLIISLLTLSYTYFLQKKRIFIEASSRMNEQLEDLSQIVDVQIKNNQNKVNMSLSIAHQILNNGDSLKEAEDEYLNYTAMNQETGEKKEVAVSKWYFGSESVHDNFNLVDKISSFTVETASIFQKIPEGYMRISTNVINNQGKRAVGSYIPNNSDVVKTIEKNQIFLGRSFEVNDWYLTAYEPIIIKGEIKGMLYVGIREKNFSMIKDIFSKKKYFESGYPLIMGREGKLLIHPKLEGKDITKTNLYPRIINSGKEIGELEYQWPENDTGRVKKMFYRYYKPIDSYFAVTYYSDEVLSPLYEFRNSMLIASGLGILVFCICLVLLGRSISLGLKKGVYFAERIASGNLTGLIKNSNKDEVGLLSLSLNKMVLNLRGMVDRIMKGTEVISSASLQLSKSIIEISGNANQQASSMDEISSSIEVMTTNIQQNTENTKRSELIMLNVDKDIVECSNLVSITVEAMRKIADKISIIDEIAFQTNILALNAAVEAARVGRAGKGFAVVAAEVRKLAERSKTAAHEIDKLSKDTVSIAVQSRDQLLKLVPEIQKASELIREVSTAGVELSSGAEQINSSILLLNETTQLNASSSEEMSTNLQELALQSAELKQLVETFKII